MTDRSTRRRWLALCGVGIATGVAGCTGGNDTAGDDSGGGGTGEQTGDSSESPIRYGDSYVAEIDLHEAGTPDITQTFYEGDVYTRTVLGNGEVFESYQIDGTTYSIVSGNCLIDSDPAAETSVPDIENPRGVQESLSPAETTTLDGESVDVYEHPDEDARWYVSTETGYPVQFEMEVATVTFHSWDDTDPITVPDMDCREL